MRAIGTDIRAEALEKLRNYGLSDADAIVTAHQPASERVSALVGGDAVDLPVDNVGEPTLVDSMLQRSLAQQVQGRRPTRSSLLRNRG
ncbi:hypothetical protein [Stenotrophomonas maltophilia]|uniref:hypothetical protein n=1 Tax=Stenotrophomonas maltophilia TaxID=40324 RepID=UPI0013DA58AC|nr:hypothetical protein [Stenotrophomonas maltophilia]